MDNGGNVYVAGMSNATWGTPVRAYTGASDAFAAKLDSAGALTWNTFLGGSNTDFARGIAMDGNVYVAGTSYATWSSPVRAFTASSDAFVAKLDSTTAALLWNTFLGGGSEDAGLGIGVDDGGDVYVAGSSSATWGNPVLAYTSLRDSFAAKLDSDGVLTWNTFLGGSRHDDGYGIAADSDGNVHVAGTSNATWGSPVRGYTSGRDAFVARIPICGDGVVIASEQCDDDNQLPGDCCSATCRYESMGSSCGDPNDTACNAPDTCDGAGSCVDRKKSAGTVCLAGTLPCDPDDTCDGTTSICAAAFAAAGTECDLDASVCTTDECDGVGTCLFVANRNCDDGNLCTQDSCDAVSGCNNDVAPATGCNASAGKVILQIRDDATNAKDRVRFKWMKGSAEMSEFGSPTTTTDYRLCVYDADGGVVGLGVAGGADCGGTPCWSLSGPAGSETGVNYKDRRKPAANDGVDQIKGKAGTAGKAKLQAKAQGDNVPAITLHAGMTYPVTAQVLTSNAGCFEATFAEGDEKANDATQFKAVHVAP